MPSSSSPAPNTVIGVNPLDGLLHDHLSHAVHGHAELVAAIVNHAEQGFLRRRVKREALPGGQVPGGAVGGPAIGLEGAAAVG